mgnify:CR=1 FL=1
MANNKIRIKRTSVTGRTPNTTNSGNSQYIDAGELALNLTDKKLFSSNGSTYFEVGSNVSTLAVTAISANGTIGTAGQVLTSNGTGVYWSSPGVSSVNTASQYTFTNTEFFQANLVVGNTTVNAYVNSSALVISGNLIANSTGANNSFYLGGTIASSYQLTGTPLNANIASYLPTYTGTVNAAAVTTSGNLIVGGDLTVNGTTTLNVPLGTALDVTGTITHVGDVTQTGDVDQTGDLTVTGTLDVGSTVQFQDIQIIFHFG